MSAAIVRKALEIVDPDIPTQRGKKRKLKPVRNSLFPEKSSLPKESAYISTEALFPISKKYTLQEAKKQFKSSKDVAEQNRKKLELIKAHSRIILDEKITKSIIERAVSRRPIQNKEQNPAETKTAFTEEDFKKFEEEYMNSAD